MNYLMNIYASQSFSTKLVIGNIIGEAVRKNQYDQYDSEILQGILFNKRVNSFIENSPIFQKSKSRLNLRFSKYSSWIIHIFYDHFLSVNWHRYSSVPLDSFVKQTYRGMLNSSVKIPYKLRRQLPDLVSKGCIGNMGTLEGIHQFMSAITVVDNFMASLHYSLEDLILNYNLFKNDFDEFLPELDEYITSIAGHEKIQQSKYILAKAS